MKCDELQYERLGDANKTYPESTLVIRKQFVDGAIDELKREHHRERHEYIDMVEHFVRDVCRGYKVTEKLITDALDKMEKSIKEIA